MGRWNTPLSTQKQRELTILENRFIKYTCPEVISYYSERYKKWVTVPIGYPSDGATDAFDLNTRAWWVHDVICDRGTWDDGTEVTNWQASRVLRDILIEDGFWFFANRWFIATWLFGGGKARKNGLV